MREPLFVISVYGCRAAVCQRVDLGPNSWTYEPAQNWQELEDEAIAAVEELGWAVTQSGMYACPLELAERAVFA